MLLSSGNEAPPTAVKPRLSRIEACDYLLASHGVQVAVATLAKYATLGGGPRFQRFNRKPLYPRDELDAWAVQKLGDVVANTGEAAAKARRTA